MTRTTSIFFVLVLACGDPTARDPAPPNIAARQNTEPNAVDPRRRIVVASSSTCVLGLDGVVRCRGEIPGAARGQRPALALETPIELSELDHALELVGTQALLCVRREDDVVRCRGAAARPGAAFDTVADVVALRGARSLAIMDRLLCGIVGDEVRCLELPLDPSAAPIRSGIDGAIELASSAELLCARRGALPIVCLRADREGPFHRIEVTESEDARSFVVSGQVCFSTGERSACAYPHSSRPPLHPAAGGVIEDAAYEVESWQSATHTTWHLGTTHCELSSRGVLTCTREYNATGEDDVRIRDVEWAQFGESEHACVLKRDQSVMCWGDNLGAAIGPAPFSANVTRVAGLPPIAEIAVIGQRYDPPAPEEVCALDRAGALWCWSDAGRSVARMTDMPPLRAIVGTEAALCGIDRDNRLECLCQPNPERNGDRGWGDTADLGAITEVIALRSSVVVRTQRGDVINVSPCYYGAIQEEFNPFEPNHHGTVDARERRHLRGARHLVAIGGHVCGLVGRRVVCDREVPTSLRQGERLSSTGRALCAWSAGRVRCERWQNNGPGDVHMIAWPDAPVRNGDRNLSFIAGRLCAWGPDAPVRCAPALDPPDGLRIVSIAAGSVGGACAVLEDGEVRCWSAIARGDGRVRDCATPILFQ